MYPVLRLAFEVALQSRLPRLGPFGVHVSRHLCWPWDLDPFLELNNGRTLTLYDLGRVPLAVRTGLIAAMRRHGWAFAVAGASVRFRRRVRVFDRLTMLSRVVGWDERFIYIEQSLWRGSECCNQVLMRCAVTSGSGFVDPSRVAEATGHTVDSPPLPRWVSAWSEADAERPWPPELAPGAAVAPGR